MTDADTAATIARLTRERDSLVEWIIKEDVHLREWTREAAVAAVLRAVGIEPEETTR